MDSLRKYKKLWNEWEVRLCIMCSLFLQIFLFFFASWRKRKTKTARLMNAKIWLGYLLANVVTNFSLGQLSNTKATSTKGQMENRIDDDKYNDLVAFFFFFFGDE